MKVLRPINKYLTMIKMIGVSLLYIVIMIISNRLILEDPLLWGLATIYMLYCILVYYTHYRHIKIEITNEKICKYKARYHYKIKYLLNLNFARLRKTVKTEIIFKDLKYFGIYQKYEILKYLKVNNGYFEEYDLSNIYIKSIKHPPRYLFKPNLLFMVFTNGTYQYIVLEEYSVSKQRKILNQIKKITGIEPFKLKTLDKYTSMNSYLYEKYWFLTIVSEMLLVLLFLVCGFVGAFLLTKLEIYLKASNDVINNQSMMRRIYWCTSSLFIIFILAMFSSKSKGSRLFHNVYKKGSYYLGAITIIAFLLALFFGW